MDRQQAQNLIKETFENPFDKDRFTGFIKNLLNQVEDAPFTYHGNYIPDAYKPYILSLERLYKYSDGEHKIDTLVVQLKKQTSLERARTMQRNFIAWYLNGSRGGELKDAALVAFVSPGEADWRFSLVKMDYRFEETKDGKVKVKEEFTPARRWSFLVGSNEDSHTAQSRLVNILADDEHNPILKQLEEAFNIETVTREFFIKYRELFIRTKEALDKVVKQNARVKADFVAKGIDTVNFAKKLLGQIVFLYFLQKKGWFGVKRDAEWGTGSKHFLRELFEGKHGSYNNFFNDILEPLFYEALRIDRSHDDHYYSRFNCKIPFLNGGLFDPIGNYDWVHMDINIPNELFSNTVKTKEGDIGNGILDIFDRYNFTVKEDEPLEKEVAIDPELLGKAYEKFNAIRPDNFEEYKAALKNGKQGAENKFNKTFGVYYTPREIVHYMCKQSLINYLYTLAEEAGLSENIKKQDIEDLIEVGEMITEHEATALIKQEKIRNGIQKSTEYVGLLSASIRKNAATIDNWLADITVCDPAVGSGAFPVGMMHEIVRTRNVLSVFLNDTKRNNYEFKRRCIEHSLYGVDIDPGAVEIAKLRLWLSLVVDEDDIRQIKPLPNLDYKIVCGNSLLGVEKNLFNNELFAELERRKPLYFNETNPSKKQEYKKKIDELIRKITNGHTEFDFEVYFSEVFHKKGGFDVVIANPPYLESRHPDFSDELKNLYQASAKRRWKDDVKYITRGSDLLIYFFENAIFNVNRNGCIVFITQNSWLDADYGKKFQSFLLKNTQVRLVIDSDFRYFASGDGPNINAVITLFVGKDSNQSNIITFARYHESFKRIASWTGQKDNPFVDSHKYIYTDNLLQKLKWGILLASSNEIIALLNLLNQKAVKIDTIKGFELSFGQGLNVSKDFVISNQLLSSLPFARKTAIPFLTSDDGAIFNVLKTSQYILDKTKLSREEIQKLKAIGVNVFDTNSTRKKPPKLIMPRGISKHYCAFNSINCYSSSFVEVYDNYENAPDDVLLNLWLFFNSSVFWLLREISGRKNLGGGMLKSEAVDLKDLPVYMEFQKTKEIKEILQRISKRQALVTIDEIETDEHKQIDQIVFDYLGMLDYERKNIVLTLKQKIIEREKKASTQSALR